MLELINIKKKYGESTYIFDGVNLKVDNMSIVELVGKNGIGKSTLLNIIGGMTKFDGELILNKFSVKENFKEYIAGVSLIGNTPFLYDYLTPSETIDMVLSFLNRERLDSSLEHLIQEIGLDKYQNTYTRELSLGTRQKLSLILALLTSPNLILLDEPFVNFDIRSRKVTLDYLKDYIIQHKAILIYATHSTDTDVANFSDKKIILKRDEQLDKVVLESDNCET
ncbi:ABC transporter ATP-binding protein [Bacillus thuringiensis]|uniref:ABC transporter ATP-binding protein n=1 Tax=Bacillus thuringiensis TaxID=1428 RepID=UPI001E57B0E2|nr:ABC transporter ATP-binding protein [Bacillus thuringiensis]MCC6081951.1 ABC transporter ATP-binding protein [Bacillus thuringiensis]